MLSAGAGVGGGALRRMEESIEVGEALDLESSSLFLGLRSRRVVGP